jgi:hypothetical protein
MKMYGWADVCLLTSALMEVSGQFQSPAALTRGTECYIITGVEFEVLTAVTMKSTVFWNAKLCNLLSSPPASGVLLRPWRCGGGMLLRDVELFPRMMQLYEHAKYSK